MYEDRISNSSSFAVNTAAKNISEHGQTLKKKIIFYEATVNEDPHVKRFVQKLRRVELVVTKNVTKRTTLKVRNSNV